MSDKLKDCPFCGADYMKLQPTADAAQQARTHRFYVYCTMCSTRGPTVFVSEGALQVAKNAAMEETAGAVGRSAKAMEHPCQ